MSDSENETEGIDKEQLHKIEANDIKTDKKHKRNKRLENRGIKPDESGSEASQSGESGEEGEEGEKVEKDPEHKSILKSQDEVKKS